MTQCDYILPQRLDPLLAPRHNHDRASAWDLNLYRRSNLDALGLFPAANLDARAFALIRHAKQNGDDYIQTPEMTNIMDIKRERLFAAMV